MLKKIEESRVIIIFLALFITLVPLSAGALILSDAKETINDIYFKQHSLDIKVENETLISKPFGLSDHSVICLRWPEEAHQLKGMFLPSDVLFISKEERIIDFREKVSPSDLVQEWAAQKKRIPAQYILVVKAGFIKKNHINLGEPIAIL